MKIVKLTDILSVYWYPQLYMYIKNNGTLDHAKTILDRYILVPIICLN